MPDVDPSPIPVPTEVPELDVLSVAGRTVRIRLHNENTLSVRKPAGVKGATIFSFVGEDAPEDISLWKFEMSTAKTTVDITFPITVEAGSKVWLTAFWFNPKLQSGPACLAVPTWVQGSMSKAA